MLNAYLPQNPCEKLRALTVALIFVEIQGPNSAVFDKTGKLYFTDSGGVGDTSLSTPKGSVFVIEGGPSGTLLKPLALECLACPSGIAVTDNDVV